jgi:hypothetical protein
LTDDVKNGKPFTPAGGVETVGTGTAANATGTARKLADDAMSARPNFRRSENNR